MPKHECDAGINTGIAEPVPIEGALTTDGQVVAVGLNESEKGIEIIADNIAVNEDVAGTVDDAYESASGGEIDAAVELSGGVIRLHGMLLYRRDGDAWVLLVVGVGQQRW
jgi:hypothetical protein